MLIKRGKVWHYQTKIRGKTWRRSTKERDRARAEMVAKRIEVEVRLRRNRPDNWLKFSHAAHQEVQRLEIDVTQSQARRALTSFTQFLKWTRRDLDITEIDRALLEDFQRYRLRTKASSTVSADLNFILRLLRQNDILVPKPSPKPGRFTESRAFTREEINRLFINCAPRMRPLYATLLCTGARVAELIPSDRSTHTPLLKSEIDFREERIHLRQAKGVPGRPAKARPPLPVPGFLLELLRWQVDQTPAEYELVFTKQHNLRRDFREALAAAKIKRIDAVGRRIWLHSFRHTYCTLLAQQVPNTWLLKEILGHSKISTTEKYTHVSAEMVPIAAVDIFTPLDGEVVGSSDSDSGSLTIGKTKSAESVSE